MGEDSPRPAGGDSSLAQGVVEALSRWPFDVVRVEPIKVRENAVYAVHVAGGGRVVLRVHRFGYHSDQALQSELSWMSALGAHGIAVPRVIPSKQGSHFELTEFPGSSQKRQVDVFEWIEGQPLGSVEQGLSVADSEIDRIYGGVGELAAGIHNHADHWQPPAGFRRHAWDLNGLLGDDPFWGRFWELDALSPAQRAVLETLRARATRDLVRYGSTPDRFGMIHADLVPENILVEGQRLRVIDFDDAGFGWHLFEIATSLYFIRREPFFQRARDALIAAYRRVRPIPDEHLRLLPMFLAVRGTTYLGWVHTRKGEATAQALTPQLIELAMAVAEDYLAEDEMRG